MRALDKDTVLANNRCPALLDLTLQGFYLHQAQIQNILFHHPKISFQLILLTFQHVFLILRLIFFS